MDSHTEVVPCLMRIGDNVKKYKIFKFKDDQITIGRSVEVTFSILSDMISRCHAIVKRQEDSTWTITDNKSLNGITINGRRLPPSQPQLLHDGDMVQLGIPKTANEPAEFIFKFFSSLKVRVEKSSKKQKTSHPCNSSEPECSRTAHENNEEEAEEKRKSSKPSATASRTSPRSSPSKALRDQMEQSRQEQAAREVEYQARLAELEKRLQDREKEQKEVQEQLEKERTEKEHQAKECDELRLKEASILMEMEDKEKQLEKEKEELRMKMQAELEASLKEKEAALLGQLESERDTLIQEKKQVEENLQKEMEKAIEGKNKELEEQLTEQKEKLQKVIEKKEMEQKLLESQLNETKEESATAKMSALKAKEEVLCNFVDLMEMELQCSICSELFIKATSLNCSHAFCKLCINQWMKVRKECPNCRQPITSTLQSFALDSYIDKMVEQLNEDMKFKRKELVEERRADEAKFNAKEGGPSTSKAAAPPAPAGRAIPLVVVVPPAIVVAQQLRAAQAAEQAARTAAAQQAARGNRGRNNTRGGRNNRGRGARNARGGGANAQTTNDNHGEGVHSRVFFDIAKDGRPMGRIQFKLFTQTPRTAENFKQLCSGQLGFGYKGSCFHRVIPGFMAQGGDFTNNNGTGGKSIYGAKFADENFLMQHNGLGTLSMANTGPNTNGSQFFICLSPAHWLDGKHVVFGIIEQGFEVAMAVERLGSHNGRTSAKITIANCGVL